MRLIQATDKNEYNIYVAAQGSGSFLQSWEWGEWNKNLGRDIFRYWILNDAGDKVGSVQFVKMPLLFGKYYLYAPYGPVGDFKIEGLKIGLQEEFPDAIFIRIEPIEQVSWSASQLVRKSTNIQPAITMVLDLHKSEEDLLAGMHQKTRYNIRVAAKHEVVVEDEFAITPGQGLYSKEAVDLILQTQARQAYRGHGEKYYKDLVNFFALNNKNNDLKLHIYKALYQKQLLAAGIFIDFGKIRMYLYGGSSDQHREVMAPYIMHWQAIRDAKNQGIMIYDFGGSEVASGGERGFTRFKQGFGGRVVNYSGAYDVVFNPVQYKIYTLLRAVNKTIKKIRS